MIRLFLVIVVSVSFLPAKQRPNILFLFADDQRADTVSAHGNPHIQTPHLDQMSREGFSFRKNYCAGSFSGAVCVASRAMLMTGQHWMSLPSEKPQANWGTNQTLPALLKKCGGYQPFIIGKWHNGETAFLKGFKNGSSSTAQFNQPGGIAIDSKGNIFIADSWNLSLIHI